MQLHHRVKTSHRLLSLLLLAMPLAADAAAHYEKATIDGETRLRILDSKGAQHTPKKLPDQTGFSAAAISDDATTVGWLALYPNCCTSYPIPLALVIYRDGRILRTFSNDMAIWSWHFEANGRQVAFEQETVHGHRGVHYELHDIDSGQLLGKYEGDPAPDAPQWVRDVTLPN